MAQRAAAHGKPASDSMITAALPPNSSNTRLLPAFDRMAQPALPLPVNVIGAKVLLTSGSITSTVDRLEAQGLVKRGSHPTDRRAYLVSLTAAGRRKIRPASSKHARKMAKLVRTLTPGEQRELSEWLAGLAGRDVSAHWDANWWEQPGAWSRAWADSWQSK